MSEEQLKADAGPQQDETLKTKSWPTRGSQTKPGEYLRPRKSIKEVCMEEPKEGGTSVSPRSTSKEKINYIRSDGETAQAHSYNSDRWRSEQRTVPLPSVIR